MPKQVKAVPVEPAGPASVEPTLEPQPSSSAQQPPQPPARKKRNYTMTPGRAEALRRANEARSKRQAEREEIRRRDDQERQHRALDDRIGVIMEKYLSKMVAPVESKTVSRGQVSKRRWPAMTATQRRRYEQRQQQPSNNEDEDAEDDDVDSDDDDDDEEDDEVGVPHPPPPPLKPQGKPSVSVAQPRAPSHHDLMYSMIFGGARR